MPRNSLIVSYVVGLLKSNRHNNYAAITALQDNFAFQKLAYFQLSSMSNRLLDYSFNSFFSKHISGLHTAFWPRDALLIWVFIYTHLLDSEY